MWGSVLTGIEPISTGRRAGQTAPSAACGGRTRAQRGSSCAKVCQVNAHFQRLFTFYGLFCAKRRPRTGMNARMNELSCGSWNFRNDTPSNPMSVYDAPRSSPWAGKDPVCHPHAGLVCLGGCEKRPPRLFFGLPFIWTPRPLSRIGVTSGAAARPAPYPPSHCSSTVRASSRPCGA
jgi:hypothetical protein